MSDTARKDEIDEVMSSVRELVSSGVKRKDDASPNDGAMERFVLTPALRVAEAEPDIDDASDASPDPAAENILVLDPGRRADPHGLEATLAELEAAAKSETGDWDGDADAGGAEGALWASGAFSKTDDDSGNNNASGLDDADEPLWQADDDVGKAGLADFLDSTQTLDKEILRAMVAEIIREELSGALGERITRNARKLVRREINRILASRDLD